MYRRIRKIVEQLSHGVILKRRFSKSLGGNVIYVTPEARLGFWRKNLEKTDPELIALVKKMVKPGLTVWDIGANVGLFSFAAAHMAGKNGMVLSVEPDSFLVNLLRRSVSIQSLTNAPVNVLCTAISNNLAISEFSVAKRGRASNFLTRSKGRSQSDGIRNTFPTMVVSLDWLLDYFSPPDLVKIDVEGAEFDVLDGAKRLLREVRPIIYCEIGRDKSKLIYELLQENNYTVFDGTDLEFKRALKHCPFNCLALPQESIL